MLKTWKDIGKFLGMSERTVRRHYITSKKTKDPMPVFISGIVRALPDELEAWKKRHELDSIKQIASFMGISVRTFYKKRRLAIENKDPIPLNGNKANPQEIIDWLKRQ